MTNPDTAKNIVPTHLGLILDGNRRWARAEGLPTLEGHKRGYANLKAIARAASERGVKYVSAYVFSTENWNRSQEEVAYLMKLLLWVAKHEVKQLHKDNVRVVFLGSKDRLSASIIEAMAKAEAMTAQNTGGTLALCLNYGGHQEIADACKQIAETGIRAEGITPERIQKHLYGPDLPPIDLIIRTSGEQRLSGFMLWSASYAELLFVDKPWPAFNADDLDAALAEYASRQRRFGK